MEVNLKTNYISTSHLLANELKSGLQDGSPCPVCGSIHHPLPASLKDGEVATKEELESVKGTMAELGLCPSIESQENDKEIIDKVLARINEKLPIISM